MQCLLFSDYDKYGVDYAMGLLHLMGEISRNFKLWLNELFYDIENLLIKEKNNDTQL
jgi:hypothetical protein